MPVRETPSARIDRLLAAGDAAGALRAADELLVQSPNSYLGRIGRVRANLRIGNHVAAERDMEICARLAPNDEQYRLLRSGMDFRIGKVAESIELLRPIAKGRGPNSVEAGIMLLQNLFYAGRFEEMARLVHEGGPWTKDPRAALHLARTRAFEDREAGIEALKGVFRSPLPWMVRRFAGFEAVGFLDKAGRYREAFDLAKEVHAATTGPVELEPWTGLAAEQMAMFEKGAGHFRPRCANEPGTAFVVAMPRSGTTLLEQMLDRHPEIGGIGEFDGLDTIGRSIFSLPGWPRNPGLVPQKPLEELRAHYLAGAAQLRKPGASWTFDKSLRAWRMLPEIATLFPGAVCINVDRDPRDVATSIFLSYFNPQTYEWTSSFPAIREVIACQRRVTRRAFEVLELSHEAIVYEDLVEDPAGHAERCLARMGLAMDERVLSPEQNTKLANTLSHAQVRQPINRKSIARWKNYEWAFDSSWDEIVATHDARRKLR